MKTCQIKFSSGSQGRLPTGSQRSRSVLRRLGWLLLTASLCNCGGLTVPSALAGKDPFQGEAVRLHPDLEETLTATEVARYGLFTDVEGLQEVTFLKASWGGYLARLKVDTPAGTVWRERNIGTKTWREWRLRVVRVKSGKPWQDDPSPTAPKEGASVAAITGGAADPTLDRTGVLQDRENYLTRQTELSADRIRVWPEVPLPPSAGRESSESLAVSDYQKMSGRWFVLLEAGVRHNVTDFNNFFTDMGMIAMNWGVMLGRLMPFMSMEVGFGDLRDDFEELAGDGRSNTYGFSLGMLVRQPLGRHHQFYVSGAGGYFIRSLQWGGTFLNQNTGTITDGLVLEQQNWGLSFRAGFMFNRKHTTKSRFWDIGVGLQTTPAEEWHYFDEASNFFATERDMWVTLSIRFGDSI